MPCLRRPADMAGELFPGHDRTLDQLPDSNALVVLAGDAPEAQKR